MSKRRARASKTPFVMVSAKLKSSLGLGHPWVYGDVESGERWAVLKTYAASLERIVPWVVEALNLAREVLVREPWQEQATRLGMEACLALDDRAGALRLYRALAERLQKELGIEPGEDLREFYARVAAAGRL